MRLLYVIYISFYFSPIVSPFCVIGIRNNLTREKGVGLLLEVSEEGEDIKILVTWDATIRCLIKVLRI